MLSLEKQDVFQLLDEVEREGKYLLADLELARNCLKRNDLDGAHVALTTAIHSSNDIARDIKKTEDTLTKLTRLTRLRVV